MTIKTKDYLLVTVQFLLFILYLINPLDIYISTPIYLHYLALLTAAIGLIVLLLSIYALQKSISPFPSPKKNAILIDSGVYKYIRHPIYTAILLSTFGWAIYSGSLFRIIVFITLFLLFEIKSTFEEKLLIAKYPNYLNYKKTTGKYFPKIN